MKRLHIAVLCVMCWCVAMCSLPVAAAAPVHSQTLSLVMQDGIYIERDSTSPAYWEWPALSRGQQITDGVCRILNTTASDAVVTLDAVKLPYGERDVLAYLNAVTLTLTVQDTVIFHGRFVDLAGFTRELGVVPAGETLDIGITMACSFAYSGDTVGVTSPILWMFSANTTDTPREDIVPDVQRPVAVTVAATVAAVAIGGSVWYKYRPRRKGKHGN